MRRRQTASPNPCFILFLFSLPWVLCRQGIFFPAARFYASFRVYCCKKMRNEKKRKEGFSMTEWEKAKAGLLYNANHDASLLKERAICKDLCFQYNQCRPSADGEQRRLLKKLLGEMGDRVVITPPFWCDYGKNIFIGHDFYANHNCIILDGAPVTFGDFVFIGPNCCFSTAGHPLDAGLRDEGLEFAHPISIGSHVWIGANVTVLPGITIGNGAVIGAGSVVTHDIPENVIAAGNPCRVLREITDADRQRYRRI